MTTVERELAGWGNHPRVRCQVRRPRSIEEVAQSLGDDQIARGLGRSYGDPALNATGAVLDLRGLDRFIAFDEASGVLTCEAGVSLAQIIETFAPRGWFPPVTPGTKHVTIGGCIANDVHGKAHHVDGCFSTCVEEMSLVLADGRLVRASRELEPDLFWATFGGMGLTGVIVRATLRLRRVETTYFHQDVVVADNLEELLDAIETYDARYPYSVSWIDSLATGKTLGRGVLTAGDHARLEDLPRALRRDPLRVASPSPLRVPLDLPSSALNTLTIRALNAVLGQVQARGAKLAHYEKFFYPLDVIDDWNRGYGPRGFTQYQFVIPLEDGRRNIRAILEKIATSGQAPFLNVLKRFGPEHAETMLSFPFEGWTFAIDFPVRAGLAELLRELDAQVLDAGGRIYLGKDAFVQPETFAAMYPRLPRWREIKAAVDPETRFRSHLSDRVGLT